MNQSLFIRDGVGSNLSLLLHRATGNVAGAPVATAAECAAPLAWSLAALALAPGVEPVELAAFLDADAGPEAPPLEAALAGRYSTRSYTDTPLTPAELARFWRWAYPAAVRAEGYEPVAHAQRSLQPWNGHATLVRPVLLALRVDGMARGAYVVDETTLTARRLAADAQQLESLLETACFQAEFRSAAALLLMVGSPSDAIARYADRGYRYMLLENGVQLQRNGIACGALGLAGCITGSFSQDTWDRWLGLDGFHASVLNGFALGHNERPRALAAAVNQANQGAANARA